ncbi:hypothetical protein [Streptomyces sp. NPDC008150]|uniref:hypothetical protein n=1 Tax=Streptomyces sp. NPDC008150 TaxID=3364816 RepID=UPI0036E04DE3
MRERPEAGGEPRAETRAWPEVPARTELPHGEVRTEPHDEAQAEPIAGAEVRKKRVDLSVPQVAGSAVAAVVAAKLASYFGVYGTIFGAGVVSILATCGGTVFQHFFRRTGEQLREVTVAAKPRAQAGTFPADPDAPRAPDRRGVRAESRTTGQVPPAHGEFTEATVYRARVRSWKRPLIAAALVFGVTMAGITTYEVASGDSFSGNGGTTVGDAFTGTSSSSSSTTDDDTPAPSSTPSGSGGQEEGTPSGTATPDPDSSAGTGSGQGSDDNGGATSGTSGTTPTPEATDGGSSDSDGSGTAPTPSATATTPAPSASSRSGNDGQDQDGLATP